MAILKLLIISLIVGYAIERNGNKDKLKIGDFIFFVTVTYIVLGGLINFVIESASE